MQEITHVEGKLLKFQVIHRMSYYFHAIPFRFPEDGDKKHYTLRNVAQAVQWLVRINLFLLKKRPIVNIFYATGYLID